MDATSSSFAVSSLCAATATCSAAAVGLTWATTGDSKRSTSPRFDRPDIRPTTSVRRSTSKRTFLARPQSAITTGTRDNPWSLTPGLPAENRVSYQSATPVESLQEAEETGDAAAESLAALPQRRPSTWFRHRLTLTPSSGQSSQATDRPSTPSTYTNASNAPFFPTSAPPVNSRNRLVKRSTSQRFAGTPGLESTPFRPTFRRPATSHQRSAESRGQVVRHQRSQSSAAPSLPPGRESGDSDRKNIAVWNWEPFFKKHIVRIKGQSDAGLKSPGERFLGRKDELNCVRAPNGQLPTLVMAASITAQISIEPDFATPARLNGAHYQQYQHVNEPASAPLNRKLSQFREEFPEKSPTMNEPSPRVSSSFSLSNLIPSPSPAPFKIIRRRSSRKQDSGTILSSRHVSESHALPRLQEPGSSMAEAKLPETAGDPANGEDLQVTRTRSVSDMVALYRPSAQVDDTGADEHVTISKVRDGVPRGHRHSFSGSTERSNPAIAMASPPQSNPRLSRGSRVASDHGSTIQGSDTDNSRVFSVNGDDYDAFSETNYDSFRTGGTNSSHSGRRPTKIEGVFDDLGRDGFVGDGLSVLEEKLSDTSPSSSPRHAAETSGSHTPGRQERHDVNDQNTLPHSPKLSGSPSPARLSFASFSPSGPTPLFAHKVMTALTGQANFEDDFDELWDVPEEDSEPQVRSLRFDESDDRSHQVRSSRGDASVTPDAQKKVNLWDWSEKQQDDDRPKTVHGKNPTDRSNRAGSRRPNVHVRSQSVPNVIENNKARFNDAAKLDAWTLGGKGASEDWDEDFEVGGFEDEPEDIPLSTARQSRDFRSSGFVVPDTILEKQSSVHYQFSHVKELSQLVESLRRLRRMADELGIRDGQSSALWVEAEGIIDLATLEEDEELAPPAIARPISPTSTDFDFEHDERLSTPQSARQSISVTRDDTPSRNSPSQHIRHSANNTESPQAGSRPRQDSTVQAKTILENLPSHRNELVKPTAPINDILSQTATSSSPSRRTRPQKQPFDTQSLKDLVTRAGVVTRALQEIVRNAEDQLHSAGPATPQSHKRSGSGLGIVAVERDPYLSQLFQHPGPLSTPPSQRRSQMVRREREATPGTPSGRDAFESDITLDGLSLDTKDKLDKTLNLR